jgi:hypothetical protein
MKNLFYLLIFAVCFTFAQNVKITANYGSENGDIIDLMRFENIESETLTFKSEFLKGKSYTIGLEEFKNGKLIKTNVIFDDSYIKIDSDKVWIKFFSNLPMEN